MSNHTATVRWQRGDGEFARGRYSRAHTWAFDGGVVVAASASPHVVRPPFSDPAGVDPEEAFVASLSSCHMLTFLHLASKAGFVVDDYTDEASGVLEKNAEGRLAITRVTLKPLVTFAGEPPDATRMSALHDEAHHECFIANSVRTEIVVEAGA